MPRVRILRVLFTGGPNGGKTSALERVRLALAAHAVPRVFVYRVPESANTVLQCMDPGVREIVAGGGGGSVFQASILGIQYAAEEAAENFGRCIKESLEGSGGDNDGSGSDDGETWVVLLFDRGLGDGLAFISSEDEWVVAEEASNVQLDRETFRAVLAKHPTFDLVLHMQSRAAAADESVRNAYERLSTGTATERLHDAGASRAADEKLAQVYSTHNGYHLVIARADFDGKCTEVVRLIQAEMGIVL